MIPRPSTGSRDHSDPVGSSRQQSIASVPGSQAGTDPALSAGLNQDVGGGCVERRRLDVLEPDLDESAAVAGLAMECDQVPSPPAQYTVSPTAGTASFPLTQPGRSSGVTRKS